MLKHCFYYRRYYARDKATSPGLEAFTQNEIFGAAVQFAKTQGIIPAPEPAHAIRGAIEEAIEAREAGQERVILFNLCGHGHFDMQAYDDFLNGRLPEVEFDSADEEAALAGLPDVPIQV